MMVKALDKRRRYLVGRLNAMEGVSCVSPQGAFYAFPDFSAHYGKSFNGKRLAGSVDICNFLLEEMKVAAVPGAGFGADNHLRLSYAASLEALEKALDRVEQGLAGLSG